jgi:capsular exopolysaccharide synthesis family protein
MSDQIIPKRDPQSGNAPLITLERRGSGRAAPPATEREVSFIEIRRILLRRKRFIILCVAGLSALALVYSLVSTPKYEATSTIEFNLENSDAVSPQDVRGMATEPGAMAYHVTQDTQVRALQSDTLALQVAQQLNLQAREEFTRNQSLLDYLRRFGDESNLPLEQAPHRRANILKAFHKNLTVKAVPGSRMIMVSFLSPDPQLAAKIANALVNDFQDQQFKIRYTATAQVSDWLTEQLDGLKRQVESSQEKLVQYQKQAGILGTDETHNIIMTRLEQVDERLLSAESNRILAQTVWQLARSGNPELISGLGTPVVGVASPGAPNALALIGNLRLQQAQLKAEYAQATAKYGSAYPRLVQLKQEMRELDESIAAEVQNLASRAQNDYAAAKETEDTLRKSFEEAKAEANKLNDDALQYTILKHEVESHRSLYDTLSTQLKEAGILANLRPTNIVTIDEARPTDRPAKPSLPLNLAGGLLVGFVLGIGGAFARENLDETITSPDQAEQLTLLPSIGIVPRSKQLSGRIHDPKRPSIAAPGARILVVNRPHSRIAEAYRSIRTSLMQVSRRSECNVLLFTSALPEEGKTTTCLNCAAALAQQGAKVLLVEADMRRAALSSQLGLTASIGLSSMIDDGETDGLPLPLPSIPGLSIIPAGPKPQYPADLLGSRRMADLVEAWRAEYNYILIDTPPVLTVTDAVVASAYCDAVVLVVRSGVTKKQSLLRVRDLFRRSQKRIAGIVINAFDLNSTDHSHYFGYEPSTKNDRGYYISGAN